MFLQQGKTTGLYKILGELIGIFSFSNYYSYFNIQFIKSRGNKGYIWVGFNADSSSTTKTNPGTCGIHLYPAVPT